ncbi:Mur ligase domain-containing protein, partial [Campylobacter jejuni]
MMQNIHFIGIGGIGISALARFLKEKGFEISGSDLKESKITKELEKEGVKV